MSSAVLTCTRRYFPGDLTESHSIAVALAPASTKTGACIIPELLTRAVFNFMIKERIKDMTAELEKSREVAR